MFQPNRLISSGGGLVSSRRGFLTRSGGRVGLAVLAAVAGGLALAALGYLLAAGAHSFASVILWIALGSSALAIAYAPPICLLSDTADET